MNRLHLQKPTQIIISRILFILLSILAFCGVLQAQNDTTAINALFAKTRKLLHTHADSALAASRKADSLINLLPASEWRNRAKAKVCCNLGVMLTNNALQYQQALQYFMTGLKIEEKLNDAWILSNIYMGLGAFYAKRSNYPLALEYFLRALKANAPTGEKTRENQINQLMGAVYFYMKNYNEADRHFRASLKVARELQDSIQIASILGKLAGSLQKQGRYVESLNAYREGIYIDSVFGNVLDLATAYGNMGGVYHEQHRNKEALKLFNMSLALSKEIDFPELVSSNLGNVGIVQKELGMTSEAEKNLTEAIRIAEELENKELLFDFESALSEVYENQGNLKEALLHQKNSSEYQAALFNDKNKESMLRLEMNYEFGKQDEKLRHEHEAEVQVLQNKQRNDFLIRSFLIVGIVLILGMLFFIKRAYDNKNRAAEYLGQETQRKEVLLQEVHHRINNNLQVISSLLDMQASGSTDPKLVEMLQQSQSRIESLSKLHEMLYHNDTSTDVNIRDYIERVLDFHRDVILQRFPDVTLVSDIDPTNMPTRDAVALALIVNELVTNSCKHAFVKNRSGRITVNLHQLNGEWKLTVSDSGPGITNLSREGGLGLRLIHILANQLRASMTSFNRNGAVFELAFGH